MGAVWLLLRAEAARWKNRRNIGFLIVLIVIIISTFCYVREQEEHVTGNNKIVLGVAVEDTSEYAKLLLQYFNENEIFLQYVELIEAEEKKLMEALEAGGLDAYLAIPENFAQSMIDMENLPIKARVSMENPTKALVLRHVMEAYETYIEAVEVNCTALYRFMKEQGYTQKERNDANMEISLELIFTALGKDDIFRMRTVETEAVLEPAETISLAEHYQYTCFYFVLLFLFIPAGLRMIYLRGTRLTTRLTAVNIPMISVLAAVGFPYLVLSVAAVWGLCCKQGVQNNFWNALLLLLPWLLVFLLLGVLCENNQQYLFICSMVLVCLAVFGGSLIPEAYLPDTFREIVCRMPNRNFSYVMGGVQP